MPTPLFPFKGVHYFTVHECSSWLSNTRSASSLSFSLSLFFFFFLSEGKDARADICLFMHSVSRVTSTYVPDYAVTTSFLEVALCGRHHHQLDTIDTMQCAGNDANRKAAGGFSFFACASVYAARRRNAFAQFRPLEI